MIEKSPPPVRCQFADRLPRAAHETFTELKAGLSYFRPAGVEHDVFNGGDQELVFVEFEIVS